MSDVHRIPAADGTEIAAEVAGEGRPMLLVHGITEQRRTWGRVTAMLAARYRVAAVDLRGHGESGTSDDLSLEAMAGDLQAVATALGMERPHVVGHSLGGMVATVYASVFDPRAVVNVDQPIALAAFKEQLAQVEPMLRGDAFGPTMAALFEQLTGDRLPREERDRITALRDPRPEVVLAIWEPVLTSSEADLEALVDAVAIGVTAPYLSLHGIDPGPGYAEWLTARIPTATVEVWPEHGHYPHLVDPERFVARVADFVDAA